MPQIAILQMCSGIDPDANLAVIEDAAKQCAEQGALALFTPEMSLLLDRDRARARAWIESDGPSEMIDRISEIAAKQHLEIAIGSMPVATAGGKWANRSHYFRPDLAPPITYDKIHMFDVALATGEAWRESAAYEPGRAVVTVEDTPVGRLGLSICYDMRFPALYEALGNRRCDCIAVPAAFTVPTGRAHWHTLLRARAIEASAFVIAPAQVGHHADGRETFGHSLVVDPWGEVLLDMGGDASGLAFCEIDLNRIAEVRAQVPALANRRPIPKS
ncbi:carbon-nitrogen hydrolase family protein [Erythrobacter sp. T5W1-R]|uniref:carbon-nitrogen hydrolase family protein n=1 Tax=Erythrobacter sp. T5W1-R TaxID=3101752 RepID=UPI002AFED706|nr:carbon-nitrogen hydrolase family protein [Erythrobacter sp. T5W1-R]MEA1619534.1 carbon-nitrogen hydrolase family protein [Erythrobacter sp. T5W1-R]